MKYPLHTVSKPVSGSEAQKLAQAIQSGGYIANEVALELMQRIAARRHRKTDNGSVLDSLQLMHFMTRI